MRIQVVIKRFFGFVLAIMMALTTSAIVPISITASEAGTLTTIRPGEIWEFSNISSSNTTLHRESGRNLDTRSVRYNRDGSSAISRDAFMYGTAQIQAGNITLASGAKLVIENISGENNYVIRSNSNDVQIRRLITPVFYTQTMREGEIITFDNLTSRAQNVRWTSSVSNAVTITIRDSRGQVVSTENSGTRGGITVPALSIVSFEGLRSSNNTFYGDYIVFSGQTERLPFSGEQDIHDPSLPTVPVRIPPEYQDLHAFLDTRDFERLFVEYNAFTTVWLEQVGGWEVFALGLSSSIRQAIGIGAWNELRSGNFGETFMEEATNAIMNNRRSVQTLIRDVINDILGTTHHRSVDKDVHGVVNIFSSLASVAGRMGDREARNFGYFLDILKVVDNLDEGLSRQAQEYARNIEMLQSVRSLHTSPLWRETVDGVIRRYQEAIVSSIIDTAWDVSAGKIVSIGISPQTAAITAVLDYALNQSASVSGLETMIISDNINRVAMEAFQQAGRRIAAGYFTSNDVERYVHSFYIARGLQIRRYEAMRGSFNTGSPEWNYTNAQLGRLRQMTHNRFVFSVPFVAADNTTVAGEIGAWVIPGNQPSAWAVGSVNAAITAGLVPQNVQSNFTQATTRAEFAALAVALYETATGRTITGRANFNDTNDINVQKMGYLGVVTGVGGGNFNPNGTLTRQEAAVMLVRLAGATGQPLPPGHSDFADGAQISAWALNAVADIQTAGIMGGVGNNNFAPHGDYTREQSIVTILRLFERLN